MKLTFALLSHSNLLVRGGGRGLARTRRHRPVACSTSSSDSDDESATTLVECSSKKNVKKASLTLSSSSPLVIYTADRVKREESPSSKSEADKATMEEYPRCANETEEHVEETRKQNVENNSTPQAQEYQSCHNQALDRNRRSELLHVHFDESLNQEHDNTMLHNEDCHSFWYSPRDLANFRQERQRDIFVLRSLERLLVFHDDHSWSKTQQRAYAVFSKAKPQPQEVRDLKRATMAILLEGRSDHCLMGTSITIGLETRAIPCIHKDARARHAHLMQDVSQFQHHDQVQKEDRDNDDWHCLRDICRQHSLASRLYARHVAVIAAAGNEL